MRRLNLAYTKRSIFLYYSSNMLIFMTIRSGVSSKTLFLYRFRSTLSLKSLSSASCYDIAFFSYMSPTINVVSSFSTSDISLISYAVLFITSDVDRLPAPEFGSYEAMSMGLFSKMTEKLDEDELSRFLLLPALQLITFLMSYSVSLSKFSFASNISLSSLLICPVSC